MSDNPEWALARAEKILNGIIDEDLVLASKIKGGPECRKLIEAIARALAEVAGTDREQD